MFKTHCFLCIVAALALAAIPSSSRQSAVASAPEAQGIDLPNEDGIPKGYMIIEGDIVVPLDFYEQEATYATNLWPGGILPYVFDANVTAQNQARMLQAMAEWETVANVDFRPRNDESDYLHIQHDPVAVGRFEVRIDPGYEFEGFQRA